MKLFGLRIKPGIMVSLGICAVIFAFRSQVYWTAKATLPMTKATHVNCSVLQVLGWANRVWLATNLESDVRLLSTTPSGLRQYRIGSEIWWTPAPGFGNLADIIVEHRQGIYDGQNSRVRQGDVVLDIGAHVGVFARHALNLGASKVVAVEAAPSAIECLKRNLAAEISNGRVVIYPKGAWDQEDLLKMSLDTEDSGSNSFVKSAKGRQIDLQVTTIDKIVREVHLGRVDFIKMDIEGSERRALLGAAETLRKWKPRMAICVYHLADDPKVIPEVVRNRRSDYRHACGLCAQDASGGLSPAVFHFF